MHTKSLKAYFFLPQPLAIQKGICYNILINFFGRGESHAKIQSI